MRIERGTSREARAGAKSGEVPGHRADARAGGQVGARANARANARAGARVACCLWLPLLLLRQGVFAEVVPARGMVDYRVRTVRYDGEQIYALQGFVGYQIDLEFEAGESFSGLAAGDIEALAFVSQGNHLFLKPKATRVATNLTVLTNRREYRFEYHAMPLNAAADRASVVFALRFTYPPAPSTAAAEAGRIAAALARSGAPPLNTDYWYCGDSTLRPLRASDDGVHTRLRFAAHADLPALFVRNDDDSESLLNYSMDGGDVIVHRTARRYVLRRGRLTGCIVNRGFRGGGTRLDSGTVAPDVERTVPGAVP